MKSDFGAKSVIDALQHNSTLTTLYLSCDFVDEHGDATIADAMRQNSMLDCVFRHLEKPLRDNLISLATQATQEIFFREELGPVRPAIVAANAGLLFGILRPRLGGLLD
jgi:hypothetical protein